MNTIQDNDTYNKCSQMLDDGRYKEALKLAEAISDDALRAAVFVDAGFSLGRSGKVREGTELFEALLTTRSQEQKYARHSVLYNAANGRSALYELKRMRRKTTVPTDNDDLRMAKKLYRESLASLDTDTGSFASQLLVNYGNCLSKFGRYIESIECYQKALEAEPTNGMAAGNLGVELEHVAWLMGRYRHEYIAIAYDLLTRALGNEMHLKYGSMPAIQYFQSALARAQYFIDFHKEPILPPLPVKIKEDDNQLNEYIKFCVEKGLFLNAWVGDNRLTPGISDDIVFGTIVTELGDDYLVPELLHILNEIKESFSTARYLYFLSQKQNQVLDNISSMTEYYGIDAFEINGTYTGLCKTAYARAFDVLDKVARIVNVYFDIGRRKSSFWNVFAERQSLGEEHKIRFGSRSEVRKADNISLYALTDLCVDYFESEHVDFSTIDSHRNRITHDYLNVKLHASEKEKRDGGTIELDELQKQTGKVLHLAKYAILYSVSAVSAAESDKQDDTEKTAEIKVPNKPGQPFL
jgi:tetratricopeptide (TPR) repeat protein